MSRRQDEAFSKLAEIEGPLCRAVNLTNILTAATAGRGRPDIPEEAFMTALYLVASEAAIAATEAKELWYEAFEAGKGKSVDNPTATISRSISAT